MPLPTHTVPPALLTPPHPTQPASVSQHLGSSGRQLQGSVGVVSQQKQLACWQILAMFSKAPKCLGDSHQQLHLHR
ncbi:hypothetical protein E2C01_073646 [Portunus trituberculatus]|uniref:Uncharacterized protein n=1 Tax=Portunus trituberculatus TaxID=210409 RepID=A0A5B7I9Z7_PORTR|nr:hypothetical protein [Portunus trituberculatus]